MGRMRKVKPQNNKQSNDVLILQQQLQQQKLLQMNHVLIYTTFALMFLVIAMGFFLMPDRHENLSSTQQPPQVLAQYELKNPVLSEEIKHLKGQLVSVVSGSIEGKLESLEESIKLGSVLGSLETVRSLRKDVKALRNYTDPNKEKHQKTAEVNKVLIQEVSQLRNLIYFTLGSCSLMFAGFAAIWLKNRKRLHYQPNYIDVEQG